MPSKKFLKASQVALRWDTAGLIAGVDEAGRGPLAGPVYAAAVVLPPGKLPAALNGLADSKTLTETQRAKLFVPIQQYAIAFGIASASVEEIDRLNILQATFLAMQRAVAKILVSPDEVWVDGNRCPQLPMLTRAVVKGDARVAAISAASILAKESRDAEMRSWHVKFPQYDFLQHKGYPVPSHLVALARHGASPIHRKSFAPVRRVLEALQTKLI